MRFLSLFATFISLLLVGAAIYAVRAPLWAAIVYVTSINYLDYLPSVQFHPPKQSLVDHVIIGT